MKLKLGDIWISESHPQESFEIYGGSVDTCTDMEVKYDKSFEEQYEYNKIFFWRKHDIDKFNKYIEHKLGNKVNSTYPYAWCGECKKYTLTKKIKDFNMKLSDERAAFEDVYIG